MQADAKGQGQRAPLDLTSSILISSPLQVSVQAANVKAVLPAYSIDVAASRKEDLIQGPIVTRLRKVRNISTRFQFSVMSVIKHFSSIGRRSELRWYIVVAG